MRKGRRGEFDNSSAMFDLMFNIEPLNRQLPIDLINSEFYQLITNSNKDSEIMSHN